MPRSRVPEMLRAIERIAAKHDVRIGTFGHAGDGNLHPDLVFDRGDPPAEAKTEAVKTDLYRAALDARRHGHRRARHRRRRGATGSRSSAAPTRSASCARSRPRSTRSAS